MQPYLHGQTLSKNCDAEGVCSPDCAGLQQPIQFQIWGTSKVLKATPSPPSAAHTDLDTTVAPMSFIWLAVIVAPIATCRAHRMLARQSCMASWESLLFRL